MWRESAWIAHKGQRVDRAQQDQSLRVCADESVDEQSLWMSARRWVCVGSAESCAGAVRGLWVWTLELSSRTSRVKATCADVDGSVIRRWVADYSAELISK